MWVSIVNKKEKHWGVLQENLSCCFKGLKNLTRLKIPLEMGFLLFINK